MILQLHFHCARKLSTLHKARFDISVSLGLLSDSERSDTKSSNGPQTDPSRTPLRGNKVIKNPPSAPDVIDVIGQGGRAGRPCDPSSIKVRNTRDGALSAQNSFQKTGLTLFCNCHPYIFDCSEAWVVTEYSYRGCAIMSVTSAELR